MENYDRQVDYNPSIHKLYPLPWVYHPGELGLSNHLKKAKFINVFLPLAGVALATGSHVVRKRAFTALYLWDHVVDVDVIL